MLQEDLKNKLTTKKFLLVLDDVWYDEKIGELTNADRWRELFAPLCYGAKGSKILVTTRTNIVSRILGCPTPFRLEGLKGEDSWSLFRNCASGTEDPGNHPELKSIGECIVQKLNDSALAIKVVGAHLTANLSVEEWTRVMKSNSSNKEDIIQILRLSYECLPDHLQQCFVFCSLFPKGYSLEPDFLVNMWIAHKFVHGHTGTYESLRETGRSYFDELLSRSFFQELQYGHTVRYVMHDLMNDLASHISSGEYSRVERDGNLGEISRTVRLLSIPIERVNELHKFHNLQRLRTLIVLNEGRSLCSKLCLQADVFKEFKCIRVLDLSGCCLEFLPTCIDHLIHLRFLSLQHTQNSLPPSLCKLHHLLVFSIRWHSCFMDRRLVTFPKCLGTLSSILHIDVHHMCTVDLATSSHMPCLRAAGEFCVDKNKVHGIEVLKRMNELQGSLAITSLENVKSRDEATDAQLFRKSRIFKLKMQWGSCNASSKSDKANDVLDALRPHSGLEELIVEGYPGCVSPSWLESEWLSRLRHISISDCKCWKLLPSLGQIQSLRTLHIARMNAVVCIGPEFYGTAGFPSLEILEMIELPELAEWSSVDCSFPALLEVCIRGCPKLKKLPAVVLPPLRMSIYVSTKFCRLRNHNRLDTCFTQELSLSTFLDMLHFHCLEPVKSVNIIFEGANTLEVGLRDLRSNLPSLEELIIRGCSDLRHAFAASKQWEGDGNGFSLTSIQCFKMIGCNLAMDIFLKVFQSISFLSLWINDCIITYSTPEHVLRMPKSVNGVLEELCISGCDGLTTFVGLEAFVRLGKIEIANCPNLTTFPDFRCFPALQNLIIKNCPELKELPENGNLTTLTALVVENCNTLVSLRNIRDLHFLSKLVVRKCMKSMALPRMVSFSSLRVLIIKNCPEVVSLPEDGLPVALNCLYLAGCHRMLEEQFDKKNGSEWEKYEVLPLCFFADKSIEDIEEIAKVLMADDLARMSIKGNLVHTTDSAASLSSFPQ